MPLTSLYYDDQNNRWLSFDFADVNNIQLFEWEPADDASSSNGIWASISLDCLKDGLSLWEPNSKKTYRFYFVKNQLYRYYQTPFDLQINEKLIDELKQYSEERFIPPLKEKFQQDKKSVIPQNGNDIDEEKQKRERDIDIAVIDKQEITLKEKLAFLPDALNNLTDKSFYNVLMAGKIPPPLAKIILIHSQTQSKNNWNLMKALLRKDTMEKE